MLQTSRECDGWNKAEITKPIIPQRRFNPTNIKIDYRSTYRNAFVPVKADRSLYHGPPRKPWKSEGTFEVDSVYRTQFRPYPPQPFEKKLREEKGYSPPCQPMNIQSSYTRDYVKKNAPPARSTKRPVYLDPNPPLMDDNSTYRTEFLAWCLPPKETKKSRDEIIEENNAGRVPFQGITTYKRDYLPTKNSCLDRTTKILKTPKYPLGKFEGSTVYRCAYQPFYYVKSLNQ